MDRDLKVMDAHRLRACPGEPDAYHRVLDPRARVRSQPCLRRQGRARPSSGDRVCLRPDAISRTASKQASGRRSWGSTMAARDARHQRPQAPHGGRAQRRSRPNWAACAPAARRRSLLDPTFMVEAYGSNMALNQVATVSVPEPRMLSACRCGTSRWCSAVEKGHQSPPISALPRRPKGR